MKANDILNKIDEKLRLVYLSNRLTKEQSDQLYSEYRKRYREESLKGFFLLYGKDATEEMLRDYSEAYCSFRELYPDSTLKLTDASSYYYQAYRVDDLNVIFKFSLKGRYIGMLTEEAYQASYSLCTDILYAIMGDEEELANKAAYCVIGGILVVGFLVAMMLFTF